jgi:hypothetical protein
MKVAFYGLLVLLSFSQFTCEQRDCGCVPPSPCSGCGLQAEIKDISDLDGCAIGLELEDGTILVPERRVYVQAPKPEDDPAYYFEFTPGDIVCIEYKEVNLVTACMTGKNVFLTCIKKVPTTAQGG